MNQKIITFGEVMLRLSTPGFEKIIQSDSFNATYGGGEANVAISLAQFGIKAAHVTRFPDNNLGKAAANMLRKWNVETDHIVFGGERMGIYFFEAGAGTRTSSIIYDRNYSSFSTIEPHMIDWEQVFKGATWFHWTGITPAISQEAADTCKKAIEVANQKGIFVSSDINYRRNLWRYGKDVRDVMPGLVSGCDLIIASKNDAREILDIGSDSQTEEEVFKEVMRQYPKVKKIASTCRTSISATHNKLQGILYNRERFITSREYNINPIVDRIGGGDAFMAGLIYGLFSFDDDAKALEFAVAASVLKHFIEGDANLANIGEIVNLMEGDVSGRLVR